MGRERTADMTYEDLAQWLIDYVASYPEKYDQIAIWNEPILACAPADERFKRLKEITVPDHALPDDLLAGAKTVLVWFIPFKPHLQMDNMRGDRPSLSWGRAYLSTNEMIDRIGKAFKSLIEEAGGILTDFGGGSDYLITGNIVAGVPAVHKELMKEVSVVFAGKIDK